MEFTGRYEINAPPEAVWQALNDPDVLKPCIPGCEEIVKTSATEFLATATLKIGPVRARFKGKVTLSDLDPPRRCVLSGQGQGGVAGFANGSAEVLLGREGVRTILTYNAHANVGGKLAQIGQRLIDGAARQIADDFFARFARQLQPTTAQQERTSGGPAPRDFEAPMSNAPTANGREGLAPEVWVVGLIGVVVILLLLFSVTM